MFIFHDSVFAKVYYYYNKIEEKTIFYLKNKLNNDIEEFRRLIKYFSRNLFGG